MDTPIVEMEDIYKHFDGRVALDHARMELFGGEVLGLVGDNGAGKSTMLKILAGVLPADGGEISIRGQRVSIDSPRKSRALGIEMVYQDLALCGSLTVWENIYMGRLLVLPRHRTVLPFLDKRRMYRDASKLLRDLGIELPDLEPARSGSLRRGATGHRNMPLPPFRARGDPARRTDGEHGGLRAGEDSSILSWT